MSSSFSTVMPQMDFPEMYSDALNYGVEQLSPRNTDHLNLSADLAWDWSAAFNLQEQAPVKDDVLLLTDPQICQEAGPDITAIVSKLQYKTGELEQRMETRINEVEEKVTQLQNGLEEETARLCAEINAQIKLLKAWSAQIKKHIEKAAHIHDLQNE